MRKKSFILLVAVLVTILIALQIIHSILLQHLDEFEMVGYDEPPLPHSDISSFEKEADTLLGHMIETVRSTAMLDESGEYHIIENVFESPPANEKDVTLAIHTSVESMSFLPETIEEWEPLRMALDTLTTLERPAGALSAADVSTVHHGLIVGPLSVAAFVTAELAGEAALRLLALRLCPAGAASVHLVLPRGVELRWPAAVPGRAALCRALAAPPPPRSYQLSTAYPNNLLRGVARRAVRSEFVLSLDADMAPSAALRRQFVGLADAERLWGAPAAARVAFVLPLYEVGAGVSRPPDKATLLQLRRRWPQLLRPFYAAACAKCQAPTEYERWEAVPPAGRLEPAYDVAWRDPWEPVYVVRRDAPSYDARFKQFGFNRISHACELHVAGFTFRVLGDGFVLHRGLKSEQPPRPEQQAELDANRLLFRQFKQELKTKYPESTRRC